MTGADIHLLVLTLPSLYTCDAWVMQVEGLPQPHYQPLQ